MPSNETISFSIILTSKINGFKINHFEVLSIQLFHKNWSKHVSRHIIPWNGAENVTLTKSNLHKFFYIKIRDCQKLTVIIMNEESVVYLEDAADVGVAGSGLGAVEELEQPRDAHQSVEPHNHGARHMWSGAARPERHRTGGDRVAQKVT